MPFKKKTASDAAQMAAINSGPAPRDPFDPADGADVATNAANAMAQFINWQGNVLARLGLTSLTGDVRADNPVLLAALELIRSAGAPEPVVNRETIAYPGGSVAPGGAFTVDLYEYTGTNGRTLRSTEFLLASGPSRVVTELRTLGIIS